MRGVKTNIIGQRFGRWTIFSNAPSDKDYNAMVWGRCECGTEKILYVLALKSGKSTSCGCYAVERSIECHTTHGCTRGHIRSRGYISWVSAWGRCDNVNDQKYALYGGRGIRMCSGWRNDYGVFLKDMGDRPIGLTLDRINVNGHYSCGHCEQCIRNNLPLNCKWSTPKEQAQNRRNSKQNIGIDNVVPMI